MIRIKFGGEAINVYSQLERKGQVDYSYLIAKRDGKTEEVSRHWLESELKARARSNTRSGVFIVEKIARLEQSHDGVYRPRRI